MYRLSRSRPGVVRNILLKGVARQLHGRSDMKHFTPDYDPWDQRLCVVPDGDLFRVIRHGRADIVTDRIKRFTSTGIELASGDELAADVIISATGLNVQLLGGAELEVDGEPVPLNQRVSYKSVLLEGVPNASLVFGYTNASWTLKADLAAEYTCRLLNHMDAHGYTQAVVHAARSRPRPESVVGRLGLGLRPPGQRPVAATGHERPVAGPQRLPARRPHAAQGADRGRRAAVQVGLPFSRLHLYCGCGRPAPRSGHGLPDRCPAVPPLPAARRLPLRLYLLARSAVVMLTSMFGVVLFCLWITFVAISPLTIFAVLVLPVTAARALVRRVAPPRRAAAARRAGARVLPSGDRPRAGRPGLGDRTRRGELA